MIKNILIAILLIVLVFLLIKFFIWILPVFLIVIVSIWIYRKIKKHSTNKLKEQREDDGIQTADYTVVDE